VVRAHKLYCAGENAIINHTIDTGKIGSPELVCAKNNRIVFDDSMPFFDDKMQDPTANCISIITSNDGENTWNKIPSKKLQPFIEAKAAFIASNTNIALHNNMIWIATGDLGAIVFKSQGFGETLTVVSTP
jgi:photosystem II stability/assembly factor-like uncharacterized protein